jgi:predicted MFS family arabinose efflux permease
MLVVCFRAASSLPPQRAHCSVLTHHLLGLQAHVTFLLSSVACALSPNITVLIAARIFQVSSSPGR